jgi:hypothetical protein
MDAKEAVRTEPQGQPLPKQRKRTSAKKSGAKDSKLVVATSVHAEIADLATGIRQLKERLLLQTKEPDRASSPSTHEKPAEEEHFPAWLT